MNKTVNQKQLLHSTLDLLLSQCDKVVQMGEGFWFVACPIHKQFTTLIVQQQLNQTLRLDCYGGCRNSKIIKSLQLNPAVIEGGKGYPELRQQELERAATVLEAERAYDSYLKPEERRSEARLQAEYKKIVNIINRRYS